MAKNRTQKSKEEQRIEKIGENGFKVTVYSFDKKVKQKSHFQIRYDFETKTNVNTNTENIYNNELFSQQMTTKDSFDRFGDDLSQFILNFLSLNEKFRYESVCKQWQTLVFSQQTSLVITNLSSTKYKMDRINALIGFTDLTKSSLSIFANHLEAVLKKCTKINKIYINFNSRLIVLGAPEWSVDGTVFDVITNNCNSLNSLTICSKVENVSKNQMTRFAQKFSKNLTQLRFKYISDTLINEFFISNSFPNLKKLDFNSIRRDSKQDLIQHFEKNNCFPKLSHLKYTFSGFDGMQVMCGQKWSRMRTLDIVLDTELCPELFGGGIDRALRQISQLKCLEVFNVKIFTENTKITPIDGGLRAMAKNCLNLKRLDFIMDEIVLLNKLFDIFSLFRSLEFCEISIEYNEDLEDYGSIEQFRNCLSLRVFNLYLFNISDKHLVDINVFIPKMTNFHLRSNTGITDSTLEYLKKCENLEVFELHTYDDDNTLLNVTDSGLYELIRCCPKLRIVLLCSGLKVPFFDKCIEKMVENAKLRPKVTHILGFHEIIKLCKVFAEKRKEFEDSSLELSPNLKLVNVPDWSRIHTFHYYCNHHKF